MIPLIEMATNVKNIVAHLSDAEKREVLKSLKSAVAILQEVQIDLDVSPQQLEFNDCHVRVFQLMVLAAGQPVLKKDIREFVWDNPDLRYTDDIFHNTFYKVKRVLKNHGINIVSWGKEQWKIETSSVPVAEKLWAQIEYNINTSEERSYRKSAKYIAAQNPAVIDEASLLEPKVARVDESFVEDPNQPPSTPF